MAMSIEDLFRGPSVKSSPSAPKPKKSAKAETAKSIQPEAHVIAAIPEKHYPKKHPHGSIVVGTQVWYRGGRHWVEHVHPHWSQGTHIVLSDKPVHPDPGRLPDKNRCRFAVHADCVDLAPTTKNPYARQPTMADVERKERAKAGVRDVGDAVAEMLRAAKSLDDTYKIASVFLGIKEAELRNKYGHLNPGQQRMCLGNALRYAHKKGSIQLPPKKDRT